MLISILEKQDEAAKQELATRADLRETELRLLAGMTKLNADTKTYILLKWVAAMLIGQAALIAALSGCSPNSPRLSPPS